MNYVNRLKHRNVLEMLGFALKKHPKKMITCGVIAIVLLAGLISMPKIVYMYHKSEAHNYIQTAQNLLSSLEKQHAETSKLLETNRGMYKEYVVYEQKLKDEQTILFNFQKQVEEYESRYQNKDIDGILSDFKTEKGKSTLIDTQKSNHETFALIVSDISSVYELTGELETGYIELQQYQKTTTSTYDKNVLQQNEILKKGKNQRVKNNAKTLLHAVQISQDEFQTAYDTYPAFTKTEEGKYKLSELVQLKSRQSVVQEKMQKGRQAENDFALYWDELHAEYFTIVTNDYNKHSIDYIAEINPLYKEWTEQEQYQDTETKYKSETYSERVYKGSRIVGDKKEDIYETVTKTRQVPYQVQVTKTRNVTKNNGQPRMVPVPYDVYQFYYTIEKHTLSSVSKEEEYVGKKHAKYDYSIRSWNYKEQEEEGYVVWKQLWNDNEGIVKGQHVNPILGQ